MFSKFSEAGLFIRGTEGYEFSMSLEDRIRRLIFVKNSILSLTDKKLTLKNSPNSEEIPISVLVMAMRKWYDDKDHKATK